MRVGAMITVLAIVAVACGGSTSRRPIQSTTTTTATSTTIATTTTTSAPTTTTTTMPTSTTTTVRTEPPALGYVLSDDYTVETVAVIDGSAAGGLAYIDGVIYSADFGSHERVGDRVYRVELDGTVEQLAQIDGMDRGTAIVPWSGDNILVASFLTGLVFEVAPDGTAEIFEDTVGSPAGLTLNSSGQLTIGDCGVDRVVRLRTGRPPFDHARGEDLACPIGIAFDHAGNVYIAGFNTGVVHRATVDEELLVVHEFSSPNSGLVFSDGELFVTNRDSHAVYRIDLDSGIVDIVAGNGLAGAIDGPGSQATLSMPMGIALGDNGVIYVSHGLDGRNEPTVIRALVPVPLGEGEEG